MTRLPRLMLCAFSLAGALAPQLGRAVTSDSPCGTHGRRCVVEARTSTSHGDFVSVLRDDGLRHIMFLETGSSAFAPLFELHEVDYVDVRLISLEDPVTGRLAALVVEDHYLEGDEGEPEWQIRGFSLRTGASTFVLDAVAPPRIERQASAWLVGAKTSADDERFFCWSDDIFAPAPTPRCGAVASPQHCRLFEGQYMQHVAFGQGEATACVVVRAGLVSVEAGLSDGVAPLDITVPLNCDADAATFAFVDERGNRGSGRLRLSGRTLELELTPVRENERVPFASQSFRNYGNYRLERGRCTD